jgi:hypothetical protein
LEQVGYFKLGRRDIATINGCLGDICALAAALPIKLDAAPEAMSMVFHACHCAIPRRQRH